MVKSKAMRRYGAMQKRKIKRALNRKRKIDTYSTPVKRQVTQEPTPDSSGRKFYRGAVNAVAGVTGALAGQAAMTGVELAGSAAEYGYDYLTRTEKKSGGTVSSNAVYRRGGRGRMVKFKRKKNKNPSIATLQKKGITLCYEYRKTANTSAAEACAIGHNSMPAKVCTINLWRALFKYMLTRMNCKIKDYGELMTGEGFAAGDIFRINYYNGGLVQTTSSTDFTVASTFTYDQIPANIAAHFDDTAAIESLRLDSIEFIPINGTRYPACNFQINDLKITVYTNSILKVQNVTRELDTTLETDDITRVPLEGKIYNYRGNNFVKKVNNSLLAGFFTNVNDECIYGAWSAQSQTMLGGTSVGFYGSAAGPSNNDQTTFFKPVEPPRQYEIQNCTGMGTLTMQPGEIKTSVLTQKFTVSLQYYFQLFYGLTAAYNTKLVYNHKLGRGRVLYLDKVVGKTSTAINNIQLWVELQFRQSVLVHGSANDFTAPITFQTNF